MNRRQFLQLATAAVTLTAGGIALLDVEPIRRAYFLPPNGGWVGAPMRSWELCLAVDALRSVNERLWLDPKDRDPRLPAELRVFSSANNVAYWQRLFDSRVRLIARVDRLARAEGVRL